MYSRLKLVAKAMMRRQSLISLSITENFPEVDYKMRALSASDSDPSNLLGRDTFRSSIRTSAIFTRFMMRLVLVGTDPVVFVTDNILIFDEYDGLIEP